jgi:hypothetical protein
VDEKSRVQALEQPILYQPIGNPPPRAMDQRDSCALENPTAVVGLEETVSGNSGAFHPDVTARGPGSSAFGR